MRQRGMRPLAAMLLTAVTTFAASIGYHQTNLVSNGAVPARFTDPDLKNPWGISFGAMSPFWVADNGTGKSTLYNGAGMKQGLVVTVPPAPGSAPGTMGVPTGTVFNGTSGDFRGDRFIFATEDGIIAGWQGSLGTTAAVRADNSASGAVYKGLAIGGGNLYATDFAGGKVDVWHDGYMQMSLDAGKFTDPNLPSGYAPFGIQNIDDQLFVTFAKKEAGGDDDEPGPGFGFVDRFDLSGTLLQRFVVGVPGDPASPLNSPWGIAKAPDGFGELSNLILIGNFGNGRINAFDPTSGAFVKSLNDSSGAPIEIEGLWGLAFGNAGPGFDAHTLYFTAGPNDEADGLFGSLHEVPEPNTLFPVGGGLMALLLVRRRMPH